MKDKLILVTGGAGFVGTNLVTRLVKEGARVIVLDNYFAGTKEVHVEAKAFCTAECSPGLSPCERHRGVEYREGHTKDIEALIKEVPDLIYHLGEYSRVEQSVEEPEVVHDLNVIGTNAVLEYWKNRKCKLVYAGSSTKFGDGGKTRETSPYASTKAANTERVKAIGDEHALPYAITYFYNVFGPGERSGRYGTVIQWFKEQYLRGEPLTVTLPGTQRRNFTHVDDIVDGLIRVGEKGEGDEFGLGNEKSFSMMEVARLFGSDIIMLPERIGNRMSSGLDTTKSRSLGWDAHIALEDEILKFQKENPREGIEKKDKRLLVFTTTFHPIAGPAEEALCDLMRAMPDVHFDIVTTVFSQSAKGAVCPVGNATIHRVGFGYSLDKFLLPVLGFRVARKLHTQHKYVFVWALMASYASLAALLLKRASGLPILLTLADQYFDDVPWHSRALMSIILKGADQVYASERGQEKSASQLSSRAHMRESIGDGDAFANQIRFAYSSFVRERIQKEK